MSKPSAKVIAHSQAPNGEELITMEIELHRFVLPEFNTHRVFSRNFQSNRAIPVDKMIEQVRTNPAMPVHWGKNQRGMVAEEVLEGETLLDAQFAWRKAARDAVKNAEMMKESLVHKQIVNRLLEPFMWTKGVVTSTRDGYESFFKLRSHVDAQPEIQALSFAMEDALANSVPVKLSYGSYHTPYAVCPDYDAEEIIKVATSCTAQVSYRVLDDSLEKATKIYGMLNLPENGVYKDDPPHFSPTEHVAKVVEDMYHENWMSGNYVTGTFWQYRKALEIGKENEFYE